MNKCTRLEPRYPDRIIWDLILSFPCLKPKFCTGPWKGGFDPDKLFSAADYWSSGERLCVLFILNVWNPGDAKSKGWDFNLFDFVGTADGGNKRALLNWVLNPVWP
jgi:hypothetical protein